MNMDMSSTEMAMGPSSTNMAMDGSTTAMATMTGMAEAASTTMAKMDSMMGGCKISVVLLVIALELIRRMQREYDRHIIRHASRGQAAVIPDAEAIAGANKLADDGSVRSPVKVSTWATFNTAPSRLARFLRPFSFRPSVVQQVVRGLLYMVQFAGAYFVMLLAMYYNGYIIVCILIGAFLGFTLFGYDNLAPG
ncbi:hypothetical protein ABW21_db0201988 [Orbilia brochopaga]|nr:hypothetical protein ABW21_db0201988 [Drechslerella brochopaga]